MYKKNILLYVQKNYNMVSLLLLKLWIKIEEINLRKNNLIIITNN